MNHSKHSTTSNDYMSMDHSSHGMMHAMTFSFGYISDLLFSGLSAKTPTSLTLCCLLMFVMGIISEALKYLEARISNKERKIRAALCHTKLSTQSDTNINKSFIKQTIFGNCRARSSDIAKTDPKLFYTSWRTWITPHLCKTLIYAIRTTINYLLMLASMSFNTFIFIAIILGFSVGFFIVSLLPSPSTSPDCEIVGQDCC